MRILQNAILVKSDGTVLCSRHSFDNVSYVSKGGERYTVSGGNTKVSISGKDENIDVLTITEGSTIQDIKDKTVWRTYDKVNSKEKFIFIKNMSVEHLRNTLKTSSKIAPLHRFAMEYVLSEKLFKEREATEQAVPETSGASFSGAAVN